MREKGTVLLIRLSSLGDVILSTAAVEALAEAAPAYEIHVLTKPAFGDVFRGNPHVASILEWNPAVDGILSLADRLRRSRYDWIVDLHGNLRTRALRLLVRNSRWTSYQKGTFARRVAVVVRRQSGLPKTHVVERYIRALEPLGVAPVRRLPKLWPGEAEKVAVEERLQDAGWDRTERLIAFAPGARWPTKMWPRQHWISLLRSVKERNLGFAVLIGGREEADLCGDLLREAGVEGGNLAGATSILASAAALQGAAALVTNDSASLHLAASVGTPVLALFGPTVRGFGFFPLGARDVLLEKNLSCRPCSLHGGDRCPQGHHRCLEEISARDALEELQQMILGPSSGQASP